MKNAPVKVQPGDAALIELIHEDKYDPNFALLLAVCFQAFSLVFVFLTITQRSDEELQGKGASIPGAFLTKRTSLYRHVLTFSVFDY